MPKTVRASAVNGSLRTGRISRSGHAGIKALAMEV
jgi:hypothetical protein